MFTPLGSAQVPIVGMRPRRALHGCTHHAWMGYGRMGQALRCWKTADGGTVCSDLKYHPPGCPTAPAATESEVLPTPPEAATATCGGGGITVSASLIPSGTSGAPSTFPTALAVGGLAAAGLVAFLVFK